MTDGSAPACVPDATKRTSGAPSAASASDLKGLLEGYERSLILSALGAAGGRQRSAAELLRIQPSTLHEKMMRLGIRPHRVQKPTVSASPEVSASLHWRGRVPPGGTLEVRGLNGPVRVEAADDTEVEVSAVRRGPRSMFSAIEVRIVEHSRGVTVCAVGQGLDDSASRGLERRLSRGIASVRVDLVARVPPGVRVVASTFNDDIDIVGVASSVEAGTANGRVRFLPAAATRGRVEGPEPASPHETREGGASG